jgi:hypothetical protein
MAGEIMGRLVRKAGLSLTLGAMVLLMAGVGSYLLGDRLFA